MNWIFGLVAVVACVIFGLLGLTAGINLNPASTVRFVPNWGSLGDWISGFGALLAVIASLVLVRRNEAMQRDRESEKIEIEQWAEGFFLSVRVISKGLLPCRVKSVFFIGPGGSDAGAIPIASYMDDAGRVSLPARLEYREDIHLAWRVDKLNDLLDAVSLLNLDSLESLSIQVVTVTGEFTVPVSQELCNYLNGVTRTAKIDVVHGD